MWGSVPKSYILMTSQNARIWGLHPQCDHIECQACFTPEHPMHYQEGHPPRDITWDAMMAQIPPPMTSCTMTRFRMPGS